MSLEIRGASFEERKIPVLSTVEIKRNESLLEKLGFVKLSGGVVRLGTPHPLPCRFEGHRVNERPVREFKVEPFWVCKYAVTNREFEEFNPKRSRPPTSLRDNQPVTNVTYFNALGYTEALSRKRGLSFSLPTEPEWVYAAAPLGWEYPYQEDKAPQKNMSHNFVLGESSCETLEVDDGRYGVNCWGLLHMGGNVEEFTLGSYYTDGGAWGAITDGRYCMVKGGDFGHCPFSSGVNRRAIFDVAARSERIGFRLVHPDFKHE